MSRTFDNLISLMQIIEGLHTETIAIKLQSYEGRNGHGWWCCELSNDGYEPLVFDLDNSEDCYFAITNITGIPTKKGEL